MFSGEVPRSRAFTSSEALRLIRRQPRELFWRRALLMVSPRRPRSTTATIDALVQLVQREWVMPEWVAMHCSGWRWKDAARIADAYERSPHGGPAPVVMFLSRVSGMVDDRTSCLASARAALDASPPNEDADWSAAAGLVLVQQAPEIFMKRLPVLAARMKGVEFVLYRWAAHAALHSEEQARLRRRIEVLPGHRRDCDGEVTLALIDGEEALAKRDSKALRDSLDRIRRFVPGAEWNAVKVFEFLSRAARRPGAGPGVDRVLRALLPTEVGARAAAMLVRRGSRR